ncbi:hypothetical protein GOP47_0016500 [Adiantum capillus-veneris]|uniref:Uncharacterized protein n=1 Tax=Adiantum capillus-veneris TaxID=13818 RepID=A0A9D4ZC51_ADICA|nr:hypothetical protein GOP47_0016500 [Adiantum capillus-veneris]
MARQGLLPQFLQPWMHRRGGGCGGGGGGEHHQKQKQKQKPSSENGGKRRHMLGAMALLPCGGSGLTCSLLPTLVL